MSMYSMFVGVFLCTYASELCDMHHMICTHTSHYSRPPGKDLLEEVQALRLFADQEIPRLDMGGRMSHACRRVLVLISRGPLTG